MKYIKYILLKIAILIRFIDEPDFVATLMESRPRVDEVDEGIIYIVGNANYQKWAIFRCPSDKEEIIQLSLMSNRRPNWKVSIDFFGRPTINPSVRQVSGSYAHFWIQSGQIQWCPDSGGKINFSN